MSTAIFGLSLVVLLQPELLPLLAPPAPAPIAGPAAGALAPLERPRDAVRVWRELNQARIARGLSPLRLDGRLSAIARDHALDMVARNYFGHTNPDGLSPFDRLARAGYRYRWAAENLALDEDAPSAARALWNSSEHRENILERHFAKVGIAAVTAIDDAEIVVEDFSD